MNSKPLTCDFCGTSAEDSAGKMKDLPVRPFTYENPQLLPFQTEGAWRACVECQRWVNVGNVARLAASAARRYHPDNALARKAMTPLLAGLYTEVLRNRVGAGTAVAA